MQNMVAVQHTSQASMMMMSAPLPPAAAINTILPKVEWTVDSRYSRFFDAPSSSTNNSFKHLPSFLTYPYLNNCYNCLDTKSLIVLSLRGHSFIFWCGLCNVWARRPACVTCNMHSNLATIIIIASITTLCPAGPELDRLKPILVPLYVLQQPVAAVSSERTLNSFALSCPGYSTQHWRLVL